MKLSEPPQQRGLKRPRISCSWHLSQRELTPYSWIAQAGCRGVTGPVPQPLCMKLRLALEGKLECSSFITHPCSAQADTANGSYPVPKCENTGSACYRRERMRITRESRFERTDTSLHLQL